MIDPFMRVSPASTLKLSHEAQYCATTPDQSRMAFAARDGRFSVAAGDLALLYEGDLGVRLGAVALHPREDFLAIAARDEVLVTSQSGVRCFRFSHPEWHDYAGGAVAFVGNGSDLLAICPGKRGADVVLIHQDGNVLARSQIPITEEFDECGYYFVAHPSGTTWGIWAGAGQDGQFTSWLSVKRGRLSVRKANAFDLLDHGPIEFHPSGDELLVQSNNGLERHRFPNLKLLGRAEAPDDDFRFHPVVAYFGPGMAVVRDVFDDLLHLVDLRTMRFAGELIIAGHEARPIAEIHPSLKGERGRATDLYYFRGLQRGAILTVHRRPDTGHTISLLRPRNER